MPGKFNFGAMTAAANKDAAAELEKLETRVNQLGGQIIGPVNSIITSVKLDDSDPVDVQIDKTRRIIAALEPLAAAVQAVLQGNEPRGRRGRNNQSENRPADGSPSEPATGRSGLKEFADKAAKRARGAFADDE